MSWCIIPPHVFNSNLSSGAKVLYGTIHGMANESGYCSVTNEELAEKIEVAERTIQRYLKDLEKEGVLEIMNEDTGRLLKTMVVDETTEIDVVSTGTSMGMLLDMQVREVFDFWVRERRIAMQTVGYVMRGPSPRLATRAKCIVARIKEGYTTSDLKEAIKGCLGNAFNVQNGHTDITLICRNQAKVDMYIHYSQQQKRERSNADLEEWYG